MTTEDEAGEPPGDLRSAEGFRAAALAHRAALYRIAAGMLGDEHAAEDVVQEALARAFATRARYRGQSSPRTWLCGVVLNVCRSELRRRRVRSWLSLDRVLERAPGAEPPDAGGDAPAALDEDEQVRALRAAIARLPHKQRGALVLVSLEGVPVRDAAAALGSTEAAVWQALSRGRAALRRSLRDHA